MIDVQQRYNISSIRLLEEEGVLKKEQDGKEVRDSKKRRSNQETLM